MINDHMATISDSEELPVVETRDFSPDYSPLPPPVSPPTSSNTD